MATKSVTILVSTVAANNLMRVGGTLESGFAGVAGPTYTVPANKRLVLKSRHSFGQGSVAGRVRYIGSSTGVSDVVYTNIFGAGQMIEFTVGDANLAMSGFLEDDI